MTIISRHQPGSVMPCEQAYHFRAKLHKTMEMNNQISISLRGIGEGGLDCVCKMDTVVPWKGCPKNEEGQVAFHLVSSAFSF